MVRVHSLRPGIGWNELLPGRALHCLCRYNHITLKLPDVCAAALGVPDMKGGLFLINAFGCRFDEVTPESLHTVDIDGNIVRNGAPIPGCTDRGVLLAGFVIHSARHKVQGNTCKLWNG